MYKLEFHGTDTDTDFRDAPIVQFCKRVHDSSSCTVYSTRVTVKRVHARIPNGHPREEKRACRTSRRTSRRGSSCLSGSWQAERAAACRLPREDPRAEVGEDARVHVGVSLMEFKL